ncbi:serine hydrolase domain-containing protein [Micromonospora parva]|uniref:serine hydrolase domain-containing protein n=1 Tax=Micromonospora parva TaxID=1464048 RepID=UPI0033CB8B40
MRRTVVIALVVALAASLVGAALMPRVPRLGAQVTGDADLARLARTAVPDPTGHRGLAVALVENGRIRTAGLGDRDADGQPVEAGTAFEIGSVTKVLTGMLLADQVAAGVVHPDDRLGATWPALTGPARDVTLAELASHRAGLPRLAPGSVLGWARILWSNVSGGNPYAEQDTDTIRNAADRVSPDADERGESTTPTSGRPCSATPSPPGRASRTPICCRRGCSSRSA